jgi:hypothetical protein
LAEKYYGNNESKQRISTNTNGGKETMNQRKEIKPISTAGKYYRNNESMEKDIKKILFFL